MPDSHQSIAAYIERLLAIKDQLQEEDLKPLALDLGLTEADWELLQEELADHLTRGKAFFEHENWTDSIAEFEKALGINPIHQGALEGAARAHQLAWIKTQKKAHQDQAVAYARKLLAYAPAHDYAIKLISDTKVAEERAAHMESPISRASGRPTGNKQNVRFLMVGLAALLALVSTMVLMNEKPTPPPPSPTTPAAPTTPQVSWGRDYKLYEKFTPSIRYYPSDHTEGLTFLPREVRENTTKDSYFFQLKGYFNVADRAYSKLAMLVEGYNASGEQVFSTISHVLRDHQPTHLPGDIIPVNLFASQKEALTENVAYVALKVNESLSSPSEGLDKPSPFVNFSWQGNQPSGIDLTISQRLRKITPQIKEGAYDKLVWEVHNTGNIAIKQLVFKIEWMDKAGKIVTEKKLHFVTSSTPRIEPQQTRLNGGTYGLPDLAPEEVELYQITITQVDY